MRLEPAARVERAFPAYQADVLPLDEAGKWSPRVELNHRFLDVAEAVCRYPTRGWSGPPDSHRPSPVPQTGGSLPTLGPGMNRLAGQPLATHRESGPPLSRHPPKPRPLCKTIHEDWGDQRVPPPYLLGHSQACRATTPWPPRGSLVRL